MIMALPSDALSRIVSRVKLRILPHFMAGIYQGDTSRRELARRVTEEAIEGFIDHLRSPGVRESVISALRENASQGGMKMSRSTAELLANDVIAAMLGDR